MRRRVEKTKEVEERKGETKPENALRKDRGRGSEEEQEEEEKEEEEEEEEEEEKLGREGCLSVISKRADKQR